jgi:hypothetical protein
MSLLNEYLNAYAEMIGSSTISDNKRIKLDHATFSGIAKLGQGEGYDPFAHFGQLREEIDELDRLAEIF